MTWAKFEDRFPWNRKVRGLSDSAFRLHVSGICWSCEHLTNGVVMAEELPLVSDVRKPAKAVEELVSRGLWDVFVGGWSIHDFLEFNETRDVVMARRATDAERKRKGRENRRPAGVRPDVRPDSTWESPRESGRTGPDRPGPSRSVGSVEREVEVTAGVDPAAVDRIVRQLHERSA